LDSNDRFVHKVLTRNRSRGQLCLAEDYVEDFYRRHSGIMVLRHVWSCELGPEDLESQEDGQDATQHQEQLVGLLRAELGHGLSCLVAVGHGFGPEGSPGSIRVPTRPSVSENHLALGN